MAINRNNYEIYFLDFFEGKLDAKLVEELMQFLEMNADLKEEFDGFENITVHSEKNIVFEDKAGLKKNIIEALVTINLGNYQEKLVADLEGDLSEEEAVELQLFLERNPSLKKDREIIEKTRLVPDTSIVFEYKALLKRNAVVPFSAINASNYQEFMIAACEGDLNAEEECEFAEFMALNPGLQKEFLLFEQTKSRPDTSIVFEAKECLKRAVEQVPVYSLNPAAKQAAVFRWRNILYPLSIAACVIVVMFVYFKLNPVDFSEGRLAVYNSDIHVNKAVVLSNAQKTNTDFITTINSSSYHKNANNARNGQLANNIAKPERIHKVGLSPIAAPVSYPGEMESEDTYRELYAIIRERRYREEPVSSKNEYYSLEQYALYNVKKSLKPKEERGKVKPDDKLTMWDVADAGVRRFNNLTGADAKLSHSDDNSFSLALGDRFSYSRNIKK